MKNKNIDIASDKVTFEVTFESCGGEIGAEERGETSRPAEFESNLDVAPGVRLVRFAGGPFVYFVGRRKATAVTKWKNQCFLIRVDRAARCAAVYRDNDLLFTIRGGTVGPNTLEHLALAALRKHLMRSRKRHGKGGKGNGASGTPRPTTTRPTDD